MKQYRFESWKEEDKKDLSSLSYGHIREDKTGDLIFVPYTTYSDYSGSTVERSNCRSFLEMFNQDEDQYSGKIWEVYGGYGTRGVVILKSLFDENEEIQEVFENLDDYPLLDEDDWSTLEIEIQDESWEDWIKFDLIRLLEKDNLINEDYDEEKIQDQFYKIINEKDLYFIHEDAVSAYIDLDEVIKYWSNENED